MSVQNSVSKGRKMLCSAELELLSKEFYFLQRFRLKRGHRSDAGSGDKPSGALRIRADYSPQELRLELPLKL